MTAFKTCKVRRGEGQEKGKQPAKKIEFKNNSLQMKWNVYENDQRGRRRTQEEAVSESKRDTKFHGREWPTVLEAAESSGCKRKNTYKLA